MKNFLLLLLLSLSLFSAQAASGDLTLVSSHDSTQLTWYGNYDEITSFPDETKEYQQILMDFTLGCSDGGCSHWDYTVQMSVGEYTGAMDSTVASYDTISQMPLVLDTNWNEPFQVIEWYELGRMITPYGNYMDYAWGGTDYGFDASWEHTWTYDVTMMEPLLHGDVPVRLRFSGWPQNGRGFSGKVDFRFIEGFPTRRVSNIQKIYGGGSYTNSAQFEQDILPQKTANVSASKADLRVLVTGHGQDGEFTPIKYRALANNTVLREEDLWRDDCSENTLSPQGGTWILNRANWCPGDDVEEHWFDYSDYTSSGSFNIDLDFDDYSPNPGDASYIISAYLFEYEEINRLYDATIDEIVTPSVESEAHTITTTNATSNYVRKTATICTNPVVKLKNLGKETLTYCQIDYGVVGGSTFYYEWNGSLTYGEITEVVLPELDWNGLDASNPQFFAKTSFPNRRVDQFMHNDEKMVGFELPTVFDDGNLTFRLRANNQPQETSYTLKKNDGTVILNENSFSPNSTNNETVSLTDGCYILEVLDNDNYFFSGAGIGTGGDGLSWWVNTNNNLESSGYFEIRKTSPTQRLAYFNPDFGRKIHFEFMVGDALNEQQNPPQPGQAPTQNEVEEIVENGVTYYYMPAVGLYFSEVNVDSKLENVLSVNNKKPLDSHISVFPNPSENIVNLKVEADSDEKIKVSIKNTLGKEIENRTITANELVSFDFSNDAKGIYFISIESNGKLITKKVTIK